MKVLIVGAGMGGLALAAFLEHSDIEYEIVEKAPDWSHMGFLISIWDSGRDILNKLGLAEEFDARGSRASRYAIRNGKGELLRTIDLARLVVDYGSSITIIERSELHRLLLSKINPSRLSIGTTVSSIAQSDTAVSVVFSDGSRHDYDIVVGADGIHSQIRKSAFADAVESYENWRIWYTWIDHDNKDSATVNEYVEPREFTIVCSAGNRTTAWFFAPVDHAIWDKVEGRAARLQALFKDEPALLPSIEKLRDEDIVPTDMMKLKLKTWSNGRVVLIGDAAHSLGPLAGMGSTMAMEDAYILAGELMQISENYSHRRAFMRYEEERRRRVHEVEVISRGIHFGMLQRSRILRRIINFLMPRVPERFMFTNVDRLLRQQI